MTNPLTGDHDVVVQVSVGTLNRLLATLHQNALVNPALPTIPHSAFVRVGDDPATRVDGVHGVARVQSGVPQLELIHRSQDRVRVHVPLRAWFTPSSGSAQFPGFTYGTLRAEFGLQELAAVGTPGPHIGPGLYLPPRFHFAVDPRTVSFTSFGATSHDAAIARQAVVLLQTAFATAGGQPMLEPLMQRKLISLVGGGSQVVAIGVELGPGDPAIEQPRNISRVLTAGQDLAIAASKEFALSLLQPHLDALRQYHPVVHFNLFLTSADYTIDFTPGQARWAVDTTTVAGATVPCGALDLTIDGRATTSSVLPDCTFTIRDRLLVVFNPANQLLFLARKGSPNVQAHVLGIGIAESVVENKIAQQYNTQIDNAIQAAEPAMADTGLMQEVITQQLKLSDDQASTRLESAEFSNDGVVLRGSVSFSPRQRGSVQFGALNDLSGYGAFLSWFPGGRITAFAWKWMPPPPAPTGTTLDRVVTDRFVFQPPEGMPGLPPPSGGSTVGGRVCLYIQGRVIDPTTGAEVDAVAGDCYSVPDPPPLIIFPIFVEAEQAKRITEPLWMRMGTDPEVGIIDAARGKEEMPLTNTLICFLGAGSAPASLEIAEGIDRAGREDAGLVVLVVVPEGTLDEGAATTLRERGPEREAPIHVIEDVSGSWAQAFASALDSGPAFRLVGVDGRLVWSYDGTVDAETLAGALRENLQPSGAPGLIPLRPGPPIGRRLVGLEPPIAEDSMIAGADQPLSICFALDWASSSRRQIHRLNERAASEEGLSVVVLADTGAAEAAEFARAHAPQLIVIPDPDRSITAGYDVWLWPTTLSVAADGTVMSITTGWHPFDEDVPEMAGSPELVPDV